MSGRMRLFLLVATAVVVGVSPRAALGCTATGGGCASSHGCTVCIAFVEPTLSGDFYVNDWSNIDPNGAANLYICTNSGGSCEFKYSAFTNSLGHYPQAYRNVSCTQPDSAFTKVEFYNGSGTYLTFFGVQQFVSP